MKQSKQRVVLTITESETNEWKIESDITFEPSVKRYEKEGLHYPNVVNMGVRLAVLFKQPRFLDEMTKPIERPSGVVITDAPKL